VILYVTGYKPRVCTAVEYEPVILYVTGYTPRVCTTVKYEPVICDIIFSAVHTISQVHISLLYIL
jgi:hypothetical protein